MSKTAAKIFTLFIPGAKKRQRKRLEVPTDAPKKTWIDGKDVFLFGGLGLSGYGVWQIYPPSAYVLVGGVFFAIGVFWYMGETKNGTQ